MKGDIDTNPLISSDERMTTLIVKAVAMVATITVLGMVSCSMHSNAYEAEVVEAEAKLETEKSKAKEAESKYKIEKITSYERMIENGANPIAIRCLEKGWDRDGGVCLAVGVTTNKQSTGDF